MQPWLIPINAEAARHASQGPFFGQEHIRQQVEPFLTQPKFPHTLILGEPGIGKTHLARWIAHERGEPLEEFLCPAPLDLPRRGIVLLDEAHRQRRPEWLFPHMEDGRLTVLAATTRPELLEPAFKSRFFLVLHLTRLTQHSMEALIKHLGPGIGSEDMRVLARAAAGNPRQAHKIMSTAHAVGSYDPEKVLPVCQITMDGLTELHLRYLRVLGRADRPLGLAQIATLAYSDDQTLKNVERLLIECDLISLTSTGRALTRPGRNFVDRLNHHGL